MQKSTGSRQVDMTNTHTHLKPVIITQKPCNVITHTHTKQASARVTSPMLILVLWFPGFVCLCRYKHNEIPVYHRAMAMYSILDIQYKIYILVYVEDKEEA